MTRIRPVTLALLTFALATSGCSAFKSRDEAPKTGSLTQQFSIMDRDGRNYGVLELDPISGGKVTDVQGRLIGYVVPPSQVPAPVAMVPAPVAVQPVEPLPGVPTVR